MKKIILPYFKKLQGWVLMYAEWEGAAAVWSFSETIAAAVSNRAKQGQG